MKSLLLILFLLALTGRTQADNIDNAVKNNTVWISGKNFHSSVVLESGICDAQDSNDFNKPDLFFERVEPDVQPIIYKAKTVSVILPVFFTISFQYSLIDLPPPSFS